MIIPSNRQDYGKTAKTQMDDTGEHDISDKRRNRRNAVASFSIKGRGAANDQQAEPMMFSSCSSLGGGGENRPFPDRLIFFGRAPTLGSVRVKKQLSVK